ncbi:MAG: SDR family NAD(P)-dependent oxidoreductase [bacterium]
MSTPPYKNRTVLITGAAVRLGRAMAETLARVGWDVIVHAHRSVTQAHDLCTRLATFGGHAWLVTGDLLAADGPENVFKDALACTGHVDALVNNASQFALQPLATSTPDDFERLWRINTLAPVRLTQLLAAHLVGRHATGCAINLLDQRIAQPHAGTLPYLLSKKALEAFTLSAALELAPALRVNAVAPGAVLLPSASEAKEPAGLFPLNTRPTAGQVADAVRYLLEADAVSGQILYVDGGQHLFS